jgi:SAM-dependent methyltransferase
MADILIEHVERRWPEVHRYRNEVWKILTRRFFQAHVPTDSNTLDLGAGWGVFINNIVAGTKYAMDLNPNGANHLDKGITFLNHDCTTEWPLPDDSLDVVFTSNCFEHLPTKDDVVKTLEQVQRCLRPGGRIICLGPNIRYLPGLYWHFWDHHIAMTENALSEVLEMHELMVEECLPRFMPYTMADNSRLPPLFFVRLYLAFPLAWRVMGKQFLIVARKK